MQTTPGKSVLVKGRIVWANGDLFSGEQKKDMNTNRPLFDEQNQPIIEYGFGLAVPKMIDGQPNPMFNDPDGLWAAIYSEAQMLYQNAQIPPGFALKFKDGDGIDHNGKAFAERKGYAGHIVFTLTTRIPIKFFRYEPGVGNVLVSEGIKCGDEVQVQVQVKAHGAIGTSKPGMYLNPMMVQLWKVGEAIVNGPSADQVFGAQAPVGMDYSGPGVPQAAQMQAAPPMPGFAQAPVAAQPPAAPAYPQQPATPVAAQPMVPQTPPPAHYGVLPPAHQPQAAPAQQAPMMPPQAPAYPQQPAMPPVAQGYPTQMPQAPGAAAVPAYGGGMPGIPGMPR